MSQKAMFHHAGCPVCRDDERQIATAPDPARFDVGIVHLDTDRAGIAVARAAGAASVPAMVIAGRHLHINFGASLTDVKGGA